MGIHGLSSSTHIIRYSAQSFIILTEADARRKEGRKGQRAHMAYLPQPTSSATTQAVIILAKMDALSRIQKESEGIHGLPQIAIYTESLVFSPTPSHPSTGCLAQAHVAAAL